MSAVPALVVDSSVGFKWFVHDGESSVAEAWRLLEDHQAEEIRLVAPAHMPIEVASALALALPDERDVATAVDDLEGFEVEIVPVGASLLKRAVAIARHDLVSPYDSIFVALAETLGATLVTADRRQARTRRCPVRLLL